MPFAYFLIVLGVAACAFAIRREAQIKPMRLWHLYGPFVAAAAVAAIPFLLRAPNPGNLVVWGLALAAGAAIGVLATARIGSQAAGPSGAEYLQPLNAALAWCAGFLGGRALAIISRVRRAPHFELRQF